MLLFVPDSIWRVSKLRLRRALFPLKTSDQENLLGVVGERIRQARQNRGLTQAALAGPEFTKGYISALERGSVRPSFKALTVISRRLGLTLSELLTAPPARDREAEIAHLGEEVEFQFSFALMLLRSARIDEALDTVSRLEVNLQAHANELPGRTLYRIPYLRGLAYLQSGQPELARSELESALTLASEDEQAAASIRNQLGLVYLQLDQPYLAVELHLQCARAIEAGVVKDPGEQLRIYKNLADDYRALGDVTRAMNIYQMAVPVLSKADNLAHLIDISWSEALAFSAADNKPEARAYTARAFHLSAVADTTSEAAVLSVNFAQLLVREGRYQEAEDLLTRAERFLSHYPDPVSEAGVYFCRGDLARRQDDLEGARVHATKARTLLEPLVQPDRPAAQDAEDMPSGEAGEQLATARKSAMSRSAQTSDVYIETLHLLALLSEAEGNIEAADTLFERALEWAGRSNSEEVMYSVNFSYAKALEDRGDIKKALRHYRAAANQRPHMS